ncbi:MAG: hydrogen peroxide-inducible genes activator [Alphaproteobacteria bacterium CG_4_9_14_3_um_filter_47_13]|nr:MAG: hydrogen peroxide-inducible genes activator [Alphaproteobacteria bacterium CG_4_9_14_3_um_filter_47_13]
MSDFLGPPLDSLPTLRQLQYLLALAEHQSFSKAAEFCYVTQSTLSAGIKELETHLSQQLVNRAGKQMTLTSFGEEVAEQARIILAHARDISARARSLEKPLSGALRLGIIPTIAPYLLPQILPPLQKKFPDLELQLTEDQSARLVEQLRKGLLDLALFAFPYDMPDMVQTLLFEEPFYIACPEKTWQGKNPAILGDLENKELLLLEEGHCLRDHALAACHFRAKAERRIFNATSLPTLIQFVQHGYGMTLLPKMAVEWGIIPKNIEIIPFALPCPTRKIGLIWRKKHPQEKEFILFSETLGSLFLK